MPETRLRFNYLRYAGGEVSEEGTDVVQKASSALLPRKRHSTLGNDSLS